MLLQFLSKLLPLLLLPLGITIFLLLLQLTKKWRWPLPLSLALLWTFSIGIVSDVLWRLVESPWQRVEASSAANADAIVVLSGGLHLAPGKAKVIEWYDPDRFFSGIQLFNAGKAPKLLFTGGSSPFQPGIPPEGLIYTKEAISLGIPEEAIYSTKPVMNTSEEATEISKLLNTLLIKDAPEIILVTSAFHMQRAKRLIERKGIKVRPFPVDFKSSNKSARSPLIYPYNWIPNASRLSSSSTAIREIIGRTFYRTW